MVRSGSCIDTLKLGNGDCVMVKKIVRDPIFLQQKSEPATEADKQAVADLLDTLKENSKRCVGMKREKARITSTGTRS